jgi:hypothetical protein
MRRLALLLALAVVIHPTVAAEPEPTKKEKEAESYLKVEAKGKLRTGIMAIGGETTGTLITTPGGTFEVELPEKTDADKLNGKTVKITGSMYQRKGVEIRGVRTIIKATKVEIAE